VMLIRPLKQLELAGMCLRWVALSDLVLLLFFFSKQKTAYDIGLGIPAEPLFRSIQNRVASNIGISQSTFSVKVLNLFSRSRRKTNKRKSKHSAMLRNKETRHRMFIGLLNTTRKLA